MILDEAKVKPAIDKVNGCANRTQSRACSRYAEVKPAIDKVNEDKKFRQKFGDFRFSL